MAADAALLTEETVTSLQPYPTAKLPVALPRQITCESLTDLSPKSQLAKGESQLNGGMARQLTCESMRAFSRQNSCEEGRQDYGWSVAIIFGSIGLATSILWNQLMLCVGILVGMFGDAALSSASLSQSVCCAGTMLAATLIPSGGSTRFRITCCLTAFMSMIAVANGFAFAFHKDTFPQWMFLLAVAFNGVCTGLTQNLAASLAGVFEGAPKALLLGESLSPLVAVCVSAMTSAMPLPSQSAAAAISLGVAQIFLLVAVWSLVKLTSLKPQTLGYPDTIGRCISDGGAAQEYAYRRASELLGNSVVAGGSCTLWLFLLCSAPSMAEGVCGNSTSCKEQLPRTIISVANVAAASGRLLGFRMTGAKLKCLLVDCFLLCALGAFIICACAKGCLSETLPDAPPEALVPAIAGVLTFWCNLLVMRNDHNAQLACTHSIMAPCPVTTQIMWLAIQTGSISGTIISNVW